MSYEQKPKLTIFTNPKAGQDIIKKDGSFVTNKDGEVVAHCDFNGKITLPADLPAGDYEVNIYNNVSKAGLAYMSGNIKPAFKKREIDQHSQDKANAYVSETDSDSIPW